jgi:DNA-binding NarL/FixJ family response regulator
MNVAPAAKRKVLIATERPEIHRTVERALALLGERDAAAIQILHAHTAAEALALTSSDHPNLVFLDVTIGHDAGIGLVHFLPTAAPDLAVVALVPEETERGFRLVKQAASLGAAHVLLGEVTGDDVLRAFARAAPGSAHLANVVGSLPKRAPTIPAPPATPATPAAPVMPATPEAASSHFDGLEDLDAIGARVAVLLETIPSRDPRTALLASLSGALSAAVGREREGGSPMKDPNTSAYSFSYFVDIAGREIDLARRHGRRFALASVEVEPGATDVALDSRAAVELVLGAVRDTDVVARADEHELLVLLPETSTKGSRTLRRRVLDRVQSQQRSSTQPKLPLRVGVASFPFDGEDLSRLLRIARRRAERWAAYDPQGPLAGLLSTAVEWLGNPPLALPRRLGPFVPIDLPLREAWALLETLAREATRGGDALIGMHAPHDGTESALGLAQGIRAATLDTLGSGSSATTGPSSTRPPPDRDVLSLLTGRSVLTTSAGFEGLEVIAILAEHASYGLVGRVTGGRVLALQTHDLPIIEALVQGLEQPTLRRGPIAHGSLSSAAPASARASRSDPSSLRRKSHP